VDESLEARHCGPVVPIHTQIVHFFEGKTPFEIIVVRDRLVFGPKNGFEDVRS
jgi:hypothetical protein